MREDKYRLIWASNCVYAADALIPLHNHDFYQILYVKNGDGYIKIGERQKEARAGEIYIFRPQMMHEIRAGENGFLSYEMKFELYDEKMNGALFSFPESLSFVEGRLESTFEALLEELRNSGPYREEMIETKFLEFLILLLRCRDGERSYGGSIDVSDRFFAVVDYMNHHLSENITLKELADVAHLEKIYFLKQFKGKMKATPMAYLRHLRIREAKQLLKHSDMNVTQISSAVGFLDVHHFSSTFKKTVGISPSDYKSSAKP